MLLQFIVKMINLKNLNKSILYRVYSSGITFLIAYVLTGNFVASISISFVDLFVKIFSYYVFEQIWNKITGFSSKPVVIWLTGLSGSGKTTIANHLMLTFKKNAIVPVMLDGDDIRNVIKQNNFDMESRKLHNINVGFMASLFEKQGNVVIVSLISPCHDTRDKIRTMCRNFMEVYISTDIEVCIQRDPKGLYKKAIAGEINEFTGISSPYNPPQNPELTIDTANRSLEDCTHAILKYYKNNFKS
jgi:adenylyl-sulfate kinase